MSSLKKGDAAPNFSTVDQNDNAVTLADYSGKTVVLYFYPRDDTPGCTVQACGFRDNISELAGKGATVLGVSPDGPASHRKFIEKFDLPFDLICDEDHAIAEAYGVWVEKKNYGKTYMGVQRSTFVIGPDGTFIAVIPKVKPPEHAAEILELL